MKAGGGELEKLIDSMEKLSGAYVDLAMALTEKVRGIVHKYTFEERSDEQCKFVLSQMSPLSRLTLYFQRHHFNLLFDSLR